MAQFTKQSPNHMMEFLSRVYYLKADSLIQRSELLQILEDYKKEKMCFTHEQIEDLIQALFNDTDTDHCKKITFETLKAHLEKQPSLFENLSISTEDCLGSHKSQVLEGKLPDKKKHPILYLKNNCVYIIFLLFFIAVNVGLYIPQAFIKIYFQKHDWSYSLARVSGKCLNFNCAIIQVLVLRYCLIFLKSLGASSFLPLDHSLYFHKMCGFVILFHSVVHTVTHYINFGKCLNFNCAIIQVLVLRYCLIFLKSLGASSFLPLDHSLYFHKMCGFVILFHSVVHTVTHYINFALVVYIEELNPKKLTTAQWLFTDEPKLFGLGPGWQNLTGVVLMVVIIIIVICSVPFIRKSKYFELFYWTHLLYILFWVLLIFHAPFFWKWLICPLVLFVLEKIYGFYKMQTLHSKTYIRYMRHRSLAGTLGYLEESGEA